MSAAGSIPATDRNSRVNDARLGRQARSTRRPTLRSPDMMLSMAVRTRSG